MANPLTITVEQAQEIVRNEAKNKGWVRPELRQSQLPETLEALESLRRIRDSFGAIVHVYVRPQSWEATKHLPIIAELPPESVHEEVASFWS